MLNRRELCTRGTTALLAYLHLFICVTKVLAVFPLSLTPKRDAGGRLWQLSVKRSTIQTPCHQAIFCWRPFLAVGGGWVVVVAAWCRLAAGLVAEWCRFGDVVAAWRRSGTYARIPFGSGLAPLWHLRQNPVLCRAHRILLNMSSCD